MHSHTRTQAHTRTHAHTHKYIYIYIYIYTYIYIYIYIYTYIEKRKKKETILSSLQACFVITHSSGDFIVKNIRNHRLYTLRTCIIGVAVNFVQFLRSNALPLWLHEDTSSLRLLSDDNSGRQMIINFSLRQSLHLLLALLQGDLDAMIGSAMK